MRNRRIRKIRRKFSDPTVMFISVMIGVYYIVLGSVLVHIGVSHAIEVISLVVPALITGSLTTIFVQILIRRYKKKKAREKINSAKEAASESTEDNKK